MTASAVLASATVAAADPPIWEPSFGAPIAGVSNADDGHATITFGTLSFPFMGTTYTGANTIVVGSNGFLTLNGPNSAFNDSNVPSGPLLVGAPNPVIAPYWTDLITTDGPPEQGTVYANAIDDNLDGTVDRIVITWEANDFSCPGTPAFPACGNRAQVQLKSDGTIVMGWNLSNPVAAPQALLVGLSSGGTVTDPGSVDWSQRSFPAVIGATGYALYLASPRQFELLNRNLVFTPAGTTGFTVAQHGTQLGVTLSAPATGTVGKAQTVVATVTNHGDATANAVTLTSLIPGPTTLTGASAGCIQASGTEACSIGALSPGASAVEHFTMMPARPDAVRYLVDVAPSQLGDPIQDNEASATTAIVAPKLKAPPRASNAPPAVKLKAAKGEHLRNVARKGLAVALTCSTACDAQVIAMLGKQVLGAGDVSLTRGHRPGVVKITVASSNARGLARAAKARITFLVDASSEAGEAARSITLTLRH